MEEELLEVYRELATTLDALLPVAWNRIYLYAEVEGERGSIDLSVLNKNSELIALVDYPEWLEQEHDQHEWSDLPLYVQELQTIFERYQELEFTSFFFCLGSRGELGIEFGYQSFSDDYQLFRERMGSFIDKYAEEV
ncbi:immunity protein YezG family protein [Culicoidibacter larvae]|uniref:DUF600 family protein n=1 Tax=Culicoidibacter larvae TaxID=2579976 RepID=A0A5R8QA93_9FIRM|nr:immunity protein YezG family protein [Culicoidibacter larvae]TLG72555.1 DUF600 family protein [Culicoidibacter larvae]